MGYEHKLYIVELCPWKYDHVIIGCNSVGIREGTYSLYKCSAEPRGVSVHHGSHWSINSKEKFFYPNDEGNKNYSDPTIKRITTSQLRKWRAKGRMEYRTVHPYHSQMLCMMELCRTGNLSSILFNMNQPNRKYTLSFYKENNVVCEDVNGDLLYPIPLNIMLEALKKANNDVNYRRFDMAIGTLESMIKSGQFEGAVCTLYGS